MVKWALTILLVLSAPMLIYAGDAMIALRWDTMVAIVTALWLACAVFVLGLWRNPPSRSLRTIIACVTAGTVLTALSVNTVFLAIILATWTPNRQYP